MTTRREFIKILTGTVIVISLPVGLFGGKKKEVIVTDMANFLKNRNVEFTLEKIKIIDSSTVWPNKVMQGLAVPKDRRLDTRCWAAQIHYEEFYNDESLAIIKEEIIKDVKDIVGHTYYEQLRDMGVRA